MKNLSPENQLTVVFKASDTMGGSPVNTFAWDVQAHNDKTGSSPAGEYQGRTGVQHDGIILFNEGSDEDYNGLVVPSAA